MAKVECSRCGEKYPENSPLHSNGFLGFSEVCDDCQRELHVAYVKNKGARRSAAIAASDAAPGGSA